MLQTCVQYAYVDIIVWMKRASEMGREKTLTLTFFHAIFRHNIVSFVMSILHPFFESWRDVCAKCVCGCMMWLSTVDLDVNYCLLMYTCVDWMRWAMAHSQINVSDSHADGIVCFFFFFFILFTLRCFAHLGAHKFIHFHTQTICKLHIQLIIIFLLNTYHFFFYLSLLTSAVISTHSVFYCLTCPLPQLGLRTFWPFNMKRLQQENYHFVWHESPTEKVRLLLT